MVISDCGLFPAGKNTIKIQNHGLSFGFIQDFGPNNNNSNFILAQSLKGTKGHKIK
jgi:hypothetical protein